jgi:hypothetical protein
VKRHHAERDDYDEFVKIRKIREIRDLADFNQGAPDAFETISHRGFPSSNQAGAPLVS